MTAVSAEFKIRVRVSVFRVWRRAGVVGVFWWWWVLAGALAVVVGAEEPAVGLGGFAASGPLDDVVYLALIGRNLAVASGAVAVADFYGPA